MLLSFLACASSSIIVSSQQPPCPRSSLATATMLLQSLLTCARLLAHALASTQVLDDGRVTDSKGRTVNFANTVIILTSNLGSPFLLEAATAASSRPTTPEAGVRPPTPLSYAAAKEAALGAVKRHFPPEFLNRLDDIVCFDPLGRAQLLGVARLMAAELNERLAPKNITLVVTDAALEFSVAASYDPAYGARPLRRWLEHHM